jgi:signal transduction histidine kinase
MASVSSAAMELAGILQDHRQQITVSWAERAWLFPDFSYRSHAPEELRGWMGSNLAAVIEGLSTGSHVALDRYLTEVSLLRLHLGFDISEVIQGLLLLREIALPFIEEKVERDPRRRREVMAELDGYVRYMVARFGHLYAEAKQSELREEQERTARQAEQLAVMEERQRLARELHDSVTQSLYSMGLYAEAALDLMAMGNTDAAVEHLRQLQESARESLREMRLLIFELHPPLLEKEGLAGALHARLEAVEGRGGLHVLWHVEGDGRLPITVEKELYRIAQEALNNVLKHSRAKQVAITLRLSSAGERLYLEISDDGVGFTPALAGEKGGLGLRGMQERAERIGGTLLVESAPGHGTKVKVSLDGGH